MDAYLPPVAWRSEAFPEDLGEEAQATAAPARHKEPLRLVLLGVLPLALALAGAVAALWPAA